MVANIIIIIKTIINYTVTFMKLKDIQPKTAITIGRKKWNNYKGRQDKLQVVTTLK